MTKRVLSTRTVNEDLRSACVGVTLIQRGDKLSLQATLPPKPGSKKERPHQQQISLGLYANPDGLAQAKARALELSAQLSRSMFDWQNWLKPGGCPGGMTCADWIERYRRYQLEVAFNEQPGAEERWWKRRFYNVILKWLPAVKPLTAQVCIEAVLHYKPNTRSRQLACQVLQAFALWCQVEVDLKPYVGNYSVKRVRRRSLPTDDEIVSMIDKFRNPRWRWVAAMMATYGLRDHECWFVSLDWEEVAGFGRVLVVHVLAGKTEERFGVLPLHPEWAERWQLWDIRQPKLKVQMNDQYGERTARAFKREFAREGVEYDCECTPYDARHAYAIRGSVRYAIPMPVMSAMMGHSVQVHAQTYHHHLSQAQKYEAYRSALQRRGQD